MLLMSSPCRVVGGGWVIGGNSGNGGNGGYGGCCTLVAHQRQRRAML